MEFTAFDPLPASALNDMVENIESLADLLQVVSGNYAGVATGTTVLPWDDTIPQDNEGDEYMTIDITPRSAINILVVDIVANFATPAVKMISGALFKDGTAGALAATATLEGAINGSVPFTLRHRMIAGTTSPITFNFRAGVETAGTLTFNGIVGGRKFGGITASNITVWEIRA